MSLRSAMAFAVSLYCPYYGGGHPAYIPPDQRDDYFARWIPGAVRYSWRQRARPRVLRLVPSVRSSLRSALPRWVRAVKRNVRKLLSVQ